MMLKRSQLIRRNLSQKFKKNKKINTIQICKSGTKKGAIFNKNVKIMKDEGIPKIYTQKSYQSVKR